MTEEEQHVEPEELEPVEEHEDEGADDEAPQPVEKDWSEDEEAEARQLGWKSPDEWKGERPPGYIDNPKDFLTRLENMTPFRKMREQMEERARKLEATFEAARRRDLDRQQAEHDQRMQALLARQRKAVEEADTETFDQLTQMREQLEKQRPDAEPQPQGDPLESFYGNHEWLKDPIMRDAGAKAIDTAFKQGELPPSADTKTQVEYAEAHVRRYFPHLFKTEEQPKPKPKVDGGGLGANRKRTGFDTLPKDAREVFMRQVQKGIFKDTKEDREFFFNEYQNA